MELEHLDGLYDKYSADQFVILSISVDLYSDTPQVLQSFVQQNEEMTWTVARDTDNVAYKYGVSPIPHLVIIDAEGYKRHNHIGLTAESTLRSEIDSLLSEIVNGDSGNSDTEQTEPPYTIIAAIGVGVIVLLIVGVAVARKRSEKSKRAKKRRSRKRKR
jgi:hypothetical protein